MKNLLQGDSNLDSPNTLGLKMNACIHWTNSINADNSSLKEVYIPSLWWLTVFKDDIQKGNRVLCRWKKDFRLKSDETQQHLIHETWLVKIHSAKAHVFFFFNLMIPRKQWARKACAHVYNIPNRWLFRFTCRNKSFSDRSQTSSSQ